MIGAKDGRVSLIYSERENMKYKNTDMEYLEKLKKRRLPLLGDFELTKRCNLNCVHCCIKSDRCPSKHEELKTKQLYHILRQMRKAGVIYINLSGGEPLLRPDFKEIYVFSKKMNFAITVITNGTLITQDLIRIFKRYPPLMLEITSYGVNRQAYESVTRTPGSFAMFRKAMRLLKKSGIRFNRRTMVVKETYNEVMKNYKSILASGEKCLIAMPLYPRRDHDKLKNELIDQQRLDPEESAKFLRRFSGGNMPFQKRGPAGSEHLANCHCNSSGASVLSDGVLTPCHLMTESKLNLKRMSFLEAWERSFDVETLSEKQDQACGDCEHKSYCRWCPGIAYLETGNPKAKVPYLCQLMETVRRKRGLRS